MVNSWTRELRPGINESLDARCLSPPQRFQALRHRIRQRDDLRSELIGNGHRLENSYRCRYIGAEHVGVRADDGDLLHGPSPHRNVDVSVLDADGNQGSTARKEGERGAETRNGAAHLEHYVEAKLSLCRECHRIDVGRVTAIIGTEPTCEGKPLIVDVEDDDTSRPAGGDNRQKRADPARPDEGDQGVAPYATTPRRMHRDGHGLGEGEGIGRQC